MATRCHVHRRYSPSTPSRPSPVSLFVLNASVAVAWLLGEDTASRADLALVRLEDDEALVPNLWHLELRNGLLVAVRRGRFTADGPAERLNALYDLPIRTDTEPDPDIAFALAERHGLSFYDAIYLELAAVSIGRCNTSIKSLCRCLEPQCFARPLVQLPRHVVEMCLRVYR